jgi:hypothetical protein
LHLQADYDLQTARSVTAPEVEMTEPSASDGLPLRFDPNAASADPALPAFLARPAGAGHHGFPLVEETKDRRLVLRREHQRRGPRRVRGG